MEPGTGPNPGAGVGCTSGQSAMHQPHSARAGPKHVYDTENVNDAGQHWSDEEERDR